MPGVVRSGGYSSESQGFIDSIRRHAMLSPSAMNDAMITDLKRYMGALLDDITRLIIRRPGPL